jgi:hypothetical protein
MDFELVLAHAERIAALPADDNWPLNSEPMTPQLPSLSAHDRAPPKDNGSTLASME